MQKLENFSKNTYVVCFMNGVNQSTQLNVSGAIGVIKKVTNKHEIEVYLENQKCILPFDITELVLLSDYIGKSVCKKSNKPFKNKLQFNTIKGITTHNITGKIAFTFLEDNTVVECRTIKFDINHGK